MKFLYNVQSLGSIQLIDDFPRGTVSCFNQLLQLQHHMKICSWTRYCGSIYYGRKVIDDNHFG